MDESTDTSRLQRDIHPMPADVSSALEQRGLSGAYADRPAYQQNDYIGWIRRAKRPETRSKRISQMLDELKRGGVYMSMRWSGSRRS